MSAGGTRACWNTILGKTLVGIIYALSLCHATESQYLPYRSFYMYLLFMSGAAVIQEMPLNHMALEANEAIIPKSLGKITREAVIGRLQPPGHWTDSKLKHNFSLSVKKSYLFVLELCLEGQASSLAHFYKLTNVLSGNIAFWKPCLHYPSTSLQFIGIFQEQLIFISGAPVLATVSWGNLHTISFWWQAEHKLAIPQTCIYLHTLKVAIRGSDIQLAWI